MTPFEEELRRALKQQQPSPDFTARVLAQVQTSERMSRTPRPSTAPGLWRAPRFWGMTAAAATVLMIASGAAYQHHEHELQGEAAKQKLMVALHIAGTKLQQTQERVQQVGESQ